MPAVSLTFVTVMMFVFVDLVFIIKPIRKFGILNLLLGVFTILLASYFAFAGSIGDLPVGLQWFLSVFVALIGIFCLVRGLRAGGLSD